MNQKLRLSMALIPIAVILGMTLLVALAPTANAILQGYFTTGRVTSAVAGVVSKTLAMNNNKELALILQASGGNFGSKFWIIQVSTDNTNFITIDNVSLSTNTISIKEYSDSNKGTTVAVNPAIFPYVKTFVSAGNTGVTETLTYSAAK